MSAYFVGTLSGTSADGIDVVLVELVDQKPALVAARTYPMPEAVRREVRALSTPTDNEIERLGRLDVTLGRLIAEAVNALLSETGIANDRVTAIGTHGQTLRHRPDADPPFTLQVGDPNTIATRTGILTVSDFRRKDMALGGQGAPLAPSLHGTLFRERDTDRAVVNIGGIANVTLLPREPARPATGFDSGPGNCLLDEWVQRHTGRPHDQDGAWAASGTVIEEVLRRLAEEPYFHASPPKSSGREVFNLDWAQRCAMLSGHAPQDVQATFAELTALTVAEAIHRSLPECNEVYLCGGGARNVDLTSRLQRRLGNTRLDDTRALGIDPDWVEGCLFAWLASLAVNERPLDTTGVTGAGRAYVPGQLTPP